MSNKFFLWTVTMIMATLPMTAVAQERLLFEMAGPTNWAIEDFSVTTGEISQTTRKTIYVTSQAYKQITSIVVANTLPKTTVNDQVFAVTSFKDTTRGSTVFVPDKTIIDLMQRISLMFKAEHQTVPVIVSELATTFASGR
jgi:hypothetical protein